MSQTCFETMTLYKLPPMPWLQLNENLWQAITPLGTWEVTRDEELNWITECWATDTEVLIWGENCKDAEDGKRMAQAERDRILTESLEPVLIPDFPCSTPAIGGLKHLL